MFCYSSSSLNFSSFLRRPQPVPSCILLFFFFFFFSLLLVVSFHGVDKPTETLLSPTFDAILARSSEVIHLQKSIPHQRVLCISMKTCQQYSPDSFTFSSSFAVLEYLVSLSLVNRLNSRCWRVFRTVFSSTSRPTRLLDTTVSK